MIMLKFTKKITPLRLSGLLFSLLLGGMIFFSFLPDPKISFQELTDQLFFEDITADTLSLHYTLAYPSRYSIDSYPLTLPVYDPDAMLRSRCRTENTLSALSHMDTSGLSFEENYCHSLLQKYLQTQKRGFMYTYFEDYFSPSSGIPANYPVLMAEYTFRTRQDVLDYLALLSDTPNYFSSYLDFQKERAAKGYHTASVSLQQTAKQCSTIITPEELNDGSHFLQVTFRSRLALLTAKEILSAGEALQFIEENNRILKNVVVPAFENLKTELLSLQQADSSLEGLYKKENGKEYYQWLVQKLVGCSLSIPQIYEKILIDYENNFNEFRSLQNKISAFENYEEYLLLPFPIKDRDEMLDLLKTYSKEDFPDLSSHSDIPIKTTIKSVSKCMEEYSSPAFYMIPPIDDIGQNTIYINNSSTPEGLELFTTLAHEGYPGHLYQTVYYQSYGRQNHIPLIRYLMNYGGYVEGWAIYSEFYSYEYAARLYPEESRDFFSLWNRLLLCDRKLQLGILSLLDLKLHYYNDSPETATELLTQYGITNEETIAEIYQYILEEPGNYLKYYAGYLCFLDLKEKARALMGSDYTDHSFHEFVLNAGPSDFDHLQKRLTETFSQSSSSSMDSR